MSTEQRCVIVLKGPINKSQRILRLPHARPLTNTTKEYEYN